MHANITTKAIETLSLKPILFITLSVLLFTVTIFTLLSFTACLIYQIRKNNNFIKNRQNIKNPQQKVSTVPYTSNKDIQKSKIKDSLDNSKNDKSIPPTKVEEEEEAEYEYIDEDKYELVENDGTTMYDDDTQPSLPPRPSEINTQPRPNVHESASYNDSFGVYDTRRHALREMQNIASDKDKDQTIIRLAYYPLFKFMRRMSSHEMACMFIEKRCEKISQLTDELTAQQKKANTVVVLGRIQLTQATVTKINTFTNDIVVLGIQDTPQAKIHTELSKYGIGSVEQEKRFHILTQNTQNLLEKLQSIRPDNAYPLFPFEITDCIEQITDGINIESLMFTILHLYNTKKIDNSLMAFLINHDDKYIGMLNIICEQLGWISRYLQEFLQDSLTLVDDKKGYSLEIHIGAILQLGQAIDSRTKKLYNNTKLTKNFITHDNNSRIKTRGTSKKPIVASPISSDQEILFNTIYKIVSLSDKIKQLKSDVIKLLSLLTIDPGSKSINDIIQSYQYKQGQKNPPLYFESLPISLLILAFLTNTKNSNCYKDELKREFQYISGDVQLPDHIKCEIISDKIRQCHILDRQTLTRILESIHNNNSKIKIELNIHCITEGSKMLCPALLRIIDFFSSNNDQTITKILDAKVETSSGKSKSKPYYISIEEKLIRCTDALRIAIRHTQLCSKSTSYILFLHLDTEDYLHNFSLLSQQNMESIEGISLLLENFSPQQHITAGNTRSVIPIINKHVNNFLDAACAFVCMYFSYQYTSDPPTRRFSVGLYSNDKMTIIMEHAHNFLECQPSVAHNEHAKQKSLHPVPSPTRKIGCALPPPPPIPRKPHPHSRRSDYDRQPHSDVEETIDNTTTSILNSDRHSIKPLTSSQSTSHLA